GRRAAEQAVIVRGVPATRQGRRGAAAGDQRHELLDLRERLPVGEALAPDEGVGVDLAAGEAALHLGRGHRADLLLIDDDVPDRLVGARARVAALGAVVVDAGLFLVEAGGRRILERASAAAGAGRRARARASDDDDVAALLAADLEDLAFDLV